MSFSFIHTADWQIGKRFGGFPDEIRYLLREARLDAVGRIAEAARSARAEHVLVAGDVFDSANPPAALVLQLMARLTAHKGLVWHLLPGNHDPAQAGGVWEEVAARLPASGVRLHLDAEPVEIVPGVVLLPAPLKARTLAHDPTAYMDGLGTPAGTLRIGLAHGSVQGFGSNGDAAVPIAPDRAEKARLDYLALGDWHGRTRIGPRTWYSGTPEPDGFKDNDPGSVLHVVIPAAGVLPVVTPVETRHFQWLERRIALTAVADVSAALDDIAALPQPSERRILDVALSGDVSLDDLPALDGLRERATALSRHLDWDQTGVRALAARTDAKLLQSPTLAAVVERLGADLGSSDPSAARVAHEALGLLARYAAAAEVGSASG